MSQLSNKLRAGEDNSLTFYCPGCDMSHTIKHGAGDGPRWQWNGDAVRPTFGPSIKATYDHWVPSAADPEISRKILNGEVKQTMRSHICHTYVLDGRIEYLSDCTHFLAGKIIELPDLPDWMRDDDPSNN